MREYQLTVFLLVGNNCLQTLFQAVFLLRKELTLSTPNTAKFFNKIHSLVCTPYSDYLVVLDSEEWDARDMIPSL